MVWQHEHATAHSQCELGAMRLQSVALKNSRNQVEVSGKRTCFGRPGCLSMRQLLGLVCGGVVDVLHLDANDRLIGAEVEAAKTGLQGEQHGPNSPWAAKRLRG